MNEWAMAWAAALRDGETLPEEFQSPSADTLKTAEPLSAYHKGEALKTIRQVFMDLVHPYNPYEQRESDHILLHVHKQVSAGEVRVVLDALEKLSR